MQCALGLCPGLVLMELTTGLIHQQACNGASPQPLLMEPGDPGEKQRIPWYVINLWKFRNLGLDSNGLDMNSGPEAGAQ